jgi:farnesyl diphosphate synthase
MLDFDRWVSVSRERVEECLLRELNAVRPEASGSSVRGDQILFDAMGYGLLGGGKRIRALLAMAAGEAVEADAALCLRVGAALECIHAFSLVHDDMPCMDDDALRRGQPTVHVQFGQAQALLVGDALQTLGFEILAKSQAPAERVVGLTRELARATGLQGMAGGQAVDIHAVGMVMSQRELEAMHALKTGALIQASVSMGALCGDPTAAETQALRQYASLIGLAFQVADDVLDVTATAETLGKTPGKDAAANKPTFVGLLGLEGAQDYARGLHERAVGALEPLGAERSATLRMLARALVDRAH